MHIKSRQAITLFLLIIILLSFSVVSFSDSANYKESNVMTPLIVITSINSILSTYLFWNCLKIVIKNKKKLNIYLTIIFLLYFFVLFYIVQTSSPVEIKSWYMIDSIMNGIAGFGFLVMLYKTYKKLKHVLKNKKTYSNKP